MTDWVLGVMGGSGLYAIDELEDARWEVVETPWGDPSDHVYRGRLHGVEVVFLPRHGRGHALTPSAINYRANIDVMKRSGVTDLLSLSACGSFREDLPPGSFVMVDQFIDRTFARQKSFFGDGVVAHVSMARPVCARLAGLAADAAREAGAPVTQGGTYLVMEGPQFSTIAESRMHRAWGCDVVGMTNMPEAKLAREAELPYATVAMVTDFDAWHEEIAPVDVASVVEHLHANAARARQLISHLARRLAQTPRTGCAQGIETCLDTAILTPPEARSPALVRKLDAIAGRVLRASH